MSWIDEDERQAAAPDVAPLGAAGNVLEQHGVDEFAVAGAMVEPILEFA